MKTAVKPVKVAMARFLWVASRLMIGRLIDMAINTKPARAAAPPPTMMKKLFHWSIPMALYDTRKKYIGRGGTGPADLFLPGYGEQDAPPVAVSRVGRGADGIREILRIKLCCSRLIEPRSPCQGEFAATHP